MPVLNLRVEKQEDGGAPRPAPEALVASGPVFPVTLTLSDSSQRILTEQGRPLPTPISGLAMIDTGATRTCFDETAARKAGFPVRGTGRMASASHSHHDVPVFSGKIVLESININVEEGMGVNLSGFPGLVALIGRDLLQNAVFIYNGSDGSVSLAL